MQTYDVNAVVVDINNRLRVLEGKQRLFSERLLVVNQNMIDEYKQMMKDVKLVDSELKEMKSDLDNVKNILKHLTEESSEFVKKDSVKVLEKYINLWNPLNFVTEDEVKTMIKEALQEVKNG